jgi:RNA polymerase sigma-70 factor (ECF subfamily)
MNDGTAIAHDPAQPAPDAPDAPEPPEPKEPLDAQLERHRVELTGYCYRMLGSSFEAEDAVQDTMVRAWRSHDRFEGRSSLRSWLYRIATNVCLDMLNAGNKRARPMDLTESTPLAQAALAPRPDHTWLEPVPDARVLPAVSDPAEAAVAKESVRLAFMAALQQLPPKQRAVLILREVLAWRASEVAELLGTSVASVNSALQRARATLAERPAGEGAEAAVSNPLDEEQRKLLERYVAAFEGYDMTALTALLAEDAIMTMPPFDLWLRGPADITGFMTTLGAACAGSHLVPVEVNGLPGFAQYKPDPETGGYTAWAVQALETTPAASADRADPADEASGKASGGRITGFHCFLDTQRWFPLFGLPLHLEGKPEEGEQRP